MNMKTKETKDQTCWLSKINFQHTQKKTACIMCFFNIFFLIIKIHVVEKVLCFIKKQNNFLKIKDFEKRSKG